MHFKRTGGRKERGQQYENRHADRYSASAHLRISTSCSLQVMSPGAAPRDGRSAELRTQHGDCGASTPVEIEGGERLNEDEERIEMEIEGRSGMMEDTTGTSMCLGAVPRWLHSESVGSFQDSLQHDRV
jgi:hypothetical protein